LRKLFFNNYFYKTANLNGHEIQVNNTENDNKVFFEHYMFKKKEDIK